MQRLKEERRRQQEANVKRKQQEKDQRKRHKKGATGSTDTGSAHTFGLFVVVRVLLLLLFGSIEVNVIDSPRLR